jgi:hypothetical protein
MPLEKEMFLLLDPVLPASKANWLDTRDETSIDPARLLAQLSTEGKLWLP